ncbi:UNKNOWN [Stylonychia lemnae]|uniref:Uncharacterized protein n=1 Tax=Stylonychia lemnae TaxID=5949 RepID=A0A077ZXV0_STYLE|nr:UNKNOWN [Stylonychia lemnae]|eukprot:CDW74725.1 UNKNOWN [Stylonychia lemnae]
MYSRKKSSMISATNSMVQANNINQNTAPVTQRGSKINSTLSGTLASHKSSGLQSRDENNIGNRTTKHRKRDSINQNQVLRQSVGSSQHNTFLLESKDNINMQSLLIYKSIDNQIQTSSQDQLIKQQLTQNQNQFLTLSQQTQFENKHHNHNNYHQNYHSNSSSNNQLQSIQHQILNTNQSNNILLQHNFSSNQMTPMVHHIKPIPNQMRQNFSSTIVFDARSSKSQTGPDQSKSNIKSYDERLNLIDENDLTLIDQENEGFFNMEQHNLINEDEKLDLIYSQQRQPFKDIKNKMNHQGVQWQQILQSQESQQIFKVPNYVNRKSQNNATNNLRLRRQTLDDYYKSHESLMRSSRDENIMIISNQKISGGGTQSNNIISERDKESSSHQSHFYLNQHNHDTNLMKKSTLKTPNSFKINEMNSYSQQKLELQMFIQSEVQKILLQQNQLKSGDEINSTQRSKYIDQQENIDSNKVQLVNHMTKGSNFEEYLKPQPFMLFDQQPKSVNKRNHKRYQSLAEPDLMPEDMKQTIHQNMLEQSLKQWQNSTKLRLFNLDQEGNQIVKQTPGKIIQFDRNFANYTKRELQNYVEIIQQDLIQVRRQLTQVTSGDYLSKEELERCLKDIKSSYINEIQQKSIQVQQRDLTLQNLKIQCQVIINNANENHLVFLDFFKQLNELEVQLKESYQSGERNASFKLDSLIKSNMPKLKQLDLTQDNVNLLLNTLDSIDLKRDEHQHNNIYQEQEESLEEFDEEFHQQKLKQILQLTTKNSKKMNNFNSDKLSPRNQSFMNIRSLKQLGKQTIKKDQCTQSEIICIANKCSKELDQFKESLELKYQAVIESLRKKYCTMKLLNKAFQKQIQNKDRILINMKQSQNTHNSISYINSLDKADTICIDQSTVDQRNSICISIVQDHQLKPLVDRIRELGQLTISERDHIIELIYQYARQSQLISSDTNSLIHYRKMSHQLQQFINQAQILCKNINPYILNKNYQVCDLVQLIDQFSIQIQDKNNGSIDLRKSLGIGQLKLDIDCYLTNESERLSSKNQIMLLQNIQSYDEKQLKEVIETLVYENQDLREQIQDLKVNNELLLQMNTNEFKSPRSDFSGYNNQPFQSTSADHISRLRSKDRLESKLMKSSHMNKNSSKTSLNRGGILKKSILNTKEYFTLFDDNMTKDRTKKRVGIVQNRDLLQINHLMAGSLENILSENPKLIHTPHE